MTGGSCGEQAAAHAERSQPPHGGAGSADAMPTVTRNELVAAVAADGRAAPMEVFDVATGDLCWHASCGLPSFRRAPCGLFVSHGLADAVRRFPSPSREREHQNLHCFHSEASWPEANLLADLRSSSSSLCIWTAGNVCDKMKRFWASSGERSSVALLQHPASASM